MSLTVTHKDENENNNNNEGKKISQNKYSSQESVLALNQSGHLE